jgi:cell division septation protein DedD
MDGEGGDDGEAGKDGVSTPMSERSQHGRRLWRTILSPIIVLSAFSALSVVSALPLEAQTDPRLLEAVRNAQEGKSDSARMKVRRVLAATPPSDTLYPQILYTQAMVASDADDMRRQLQRVAVEYSWSSWADDALLRLVQLDYAGSNLEGSSRNLERLRRDYPGSALLPHASYWAARTYFDQKNPDLACRWLAEGLASSQGNIELQNQLTYLDQRCAAIRAATAAAPPSAATPTPTPQPATPTPPPTDPAAAAAPPPTPPRPDSIRSTSAAGQVPAPGARFRIQVTAVRTRSAAEDIAMNLRGKRLDARVVEDGGLYKVRVGSYATRGEAAADVPKVKAQLGGSPFVVAEP